MDSLDLDGVEEVVADERGEAAGAEVGDDGHQARPNREITVAAEKLIGERAESSPRIETAVGVVLLHRLTGTVVGQQAAPEVRGGREVFRRKSVRRQARGTRTAQPAAPSNDAHAPTRCGRRWSKGRRWTAAGGQRLEGLLKFFWR